MSKKKHKQNQSLVSDITKKNKVVSDLQKTESQPDAPIRKNTIAQ